MKNTQRAKVKCECHDFKQEVELSAKVAGVTFGVRGEVSQLSDLLICIKNSVLLKTKKDKTQEEMEQLKEIENVI